MCLKRPDRQSDTKRHSNLSKLAGIAWLAVVSILSLPLGGMIPSPGIENSWIIGLNMAFSRGMQFGKDVVFTFGPLGFIYLPNFCNVNNWMTAYICGLLVHFVLVVLFFFLLSKVIKSSPVFFCCSGLLIFILPFLTIDYKLLLTALLLLSFVTTFQAGMKRVWLKIAAMSLCLAVASAVKFNAAISSAGIIVTTIVIFACRREFTALGVTVLCFLLFYVGIWAAAGQQITGLSAYLRNSMEISSGYNYAMVLDGGKMQLAAGAAGIFLFYLIFIYGLIKRKHCLTVFTLPFSVLAFMTFKNSFVRQDWGHVSVFFAIMLFVFGLMYLVCRNEFGGLMRVLLLTLCGVMGFLTVTQNTHISQSIPQRLLSNWLSLKILVNGSSYRHNLLRDIKLLLRNQFGLMPELVEYIGNKRIDIIPWDINLLWVYDMSWSPRPVFQSYSAYTKALDSLNAGFYEKKPPDLLLYTVKTIDNRYAVFDEPATFREILLSYRPLFGGVLLEKKEGRINSERHVISSIKADIGEEIPIPQTDGYLFASIRLKYSLSGILAAIFYKGDEMLVHLATDEEVLKHRFIPSNSENGIFLSSYIADNQDLLNVLNNTREKPIRSLIFTTDKKWFYKDKIQIEFFEIRPN